MASYLIGSDKVDIAPFFIYLVSIYKITKKGAILLNSRFYKSDKILTLKQDTTIEDYGDYSIVRYISLLSITKKFAEENNLPIYNNKNKKK